MSATCTLDELNLLILDEDEREAVAAGGYCFRLLGSDSGTAFNDAEATVTQVESQLFAGASAEVSSYANMTVTLAVEILGANSAQLAAGAAALVSVLRRPDIRTLTWTAADGASEPTVFDVLAATWALAFDDFKATSYNQYTYTLTLICKPFPHSATAVVVPALEVPVSDPTTTVVDDGSATTNWSTNSQVVSATNLSTNPSVETALTGKSITLRNTKTTSATYQNTNPISGTDTYHKSFTATSTGQLTRRSDADAAAGDWFSQAQPNPAAWPTAPQTLVINGVGTTLVAGSVTHDSSVWSGHLFNTGSYTLEKNTTYTFSIFISKPGTARAIYLRRVWASGAQADVANIASIGNDDGWQRLTYTFNSGTNTSVSFYLYTAGGAQYDAGENWRFDADMVNPGSAAADYFDGSYPNARWTGTANASTSILLAPAAVSTSGGKVTVTGWGGVGGRLALTHTIDLTSEPYLRIKGHVTHAGGAAGVRTTAFRLSVGDQYLSPALQVWPGGNDGDFEVYFHPGAASIDTFELLAYVSPGPTPDTTTLSVDEVDTYSALPLIGTGRETEQTITAYGTMPAEAALTIDNGGNPLGPHTVLYTASGDYLSPSLRQYRTTGPVITTAAGSISGATETLATTQAGATTFEIDANVVPRSSYVIMAHLTGSGLTTNTAYTVSWSASLVASNTASPGGTITGTTVITATGSTQAAALYEIAALTLPPWDVTTTGSQTAVVRIQMWVSGGTWTFDEGWLADIDNGDLTVITNGTATGNLTGIQILPASVENPDPRYVGIVDDGAGNTATFDLTQWAMSYTQHRFDPAGGGSINAYLMNDAATPALGLSATYFPCWDMYAATIDTTADDATDDQAAA